MASSGGKRDDRGTGGHRDEWLDEAFVVRVGGPTNAQVPGSRSTTVAARTIEDIARDLHTARQRGGRGVVFAGGEPSLRKDLPRLLSLGSGMGFRLGLVTNGRALVYPRVRRLLREREIAYLRVGLHGPSAEVHDAGVGVEGAFSQTSAGVAGIVVEGPAALLVDVACVVDARTVGQLAAWVDRLVALPRTARLGLRFVAPVVATPHGAPAAEVARDVVAALERATRRDPSVRLAWEGLPPCLLEAHAALRDERLRFGLPALGPPEAGHDLHREPPGERTFPFPCQECLHLSTCPGAPRPFLERDGEDALRPTRVRRANSFNYEHVHDLPASFHLEAGACSARDLAFSTSTARSLLLAREAGVSLYRSPTRDFSDAELRQAKDELEQVYVDESARAVLTEFMTEVRRARLHPECRRCPDRPDCAGAMVVDPSAPFTAEERLLRAVVEGLRGRVLDVGCGEQPYRAELAALIARGAVDYHGLDPDERSLTRFREAGVGGALHLGAIETFDAAAGSFDHVLAFRSVNHFRSMLAALANIVRLLRPGGTVSLCDNVVFGMIRTADQVSYADENARHGHEHYRNWTSHQLVDLLTRFPLRVVAHHPVTRETSGQWLVVAERSCD